MERKADVYFSGVLSARQSAGQKAVSGRGTAAGQTARGETQAKHRHWMLSALTHRQLKKH